MSCFLHLLLLLELQTLTLKTSRIYHRSHKPDPDFERYLTIFMLHYGASVFHSISALSSFRVVTILHPSVVWCLAMQLGVMRLHVLCFFLGSQCKLHLKHLLHTIRLGTPWWKMPLILSCQKDLLLQSAICMPTILAIVYAKNVNSETRTVVCQSTATMWVSGLMNLRATHGFWNQGPFCSGQPY